MHDIAEFLHRHEPFAELGEDELEALAGRAEVEFFAAGAVIFRQGDPPQDRVRVVRRGAVELVEAGRMLDLLGEGELFGHPSMLSGLPTGFEARAHEDSLVYALAAEDVTPLLARPASIGYVARSLLGRPEPTPAGGHPVGDPEVASQPARALVRRPAVSCPSDTSLREVARRMAEEGIGSMLVSAADGLGIVTDRDLRARVIAEGIPIETPVAEVMTRPVITVEAERSGAEVMAAMLDNDIRHVPVLERGSLLGVISDNDLLAVESRAPFLLRRRIAEAADDAQLREAATDLRPTVIALHRAGLSALRISEVISLVADAITRRAIDLAVAKRGAPPAEFAWIALGSHGRREPVPSSDLDTGIAWRDTERPVAEPMREIAAAVGDCLAGSGLEPDSHGVTAASEFSASSIGDWRAAIEDWLGRPADDGVLFALAITLDGRVVQGPPELDPRLLLHEADVRERVLRLMLRGALEIRPPTGFFRDIVIHGGEHRDSFDAKREGVNPVIALARYAALAAGIEATSTVARLRAADGDVFEPGEAEALEQAFELLAGLRLDHQISQLEQGVERPDDRLDPGELDPLTRRYLKDAFREVAAVQGRLSSELELTRGRI